MTSGEPTVQYAEHDTERVLSYQLASQRVELVQQRQGYGMVVVRTVAQGEIERYYGLDMALDHVAELLSIPITHLEVPEEAADMGI